MISFKDFLAENQDVENTLKKIPPGHASLVKSHQVKFQIGNTLKGDNDHVGYIDDAPKEIMIAAPWHYGREFTMLHEIAHRVYEHLSPELKKQWSKVVKKHKGRQKQNDEEIFCHAYANTYAKHKMVTHTHPAWETFIKNLPPKL